MFERGNYKSRQNFTLLVVLFSTKHSYSSHDLQFWALPDPSTLKVLCEKGEAGVGTAADNTSPSKATQLSCPLPRFCSDQPSRWEPLYTQLVEQVRANQFLALQKHFFHKELLCFLSFASLLWLPATPSAWKSSRSSRISKKTKKRGG